MKNIILIEPSSAGLQLLPVAKSLQMGIFVFSANKDERIIPESYQKYIDNFVEIDTYDVSSLYAAAKKIDQKNVISAIIPGSEYHVPIASRVAAMMKLPGVHPQYVDSLRIKHYARELLKEHSVRTPRFAVIAREEEMVNAIKHVGFPCVLKPTASAGSMHVSRINNVEELRRAYDAMKADKWTELGKGVGDIALLEEYIAGEEFSVEGYIENSQAKIISITKKFLSPEPLFVEMGHITPANLDETIQASIESYMQAVIKALNINLGVFHAELRIDKKGIVLIEIAGRLAGGRICDLVQLAHGVNMYEIMIQSHLGWPIKFNPSPKRQVAGMCYFKLDGANFFTNVHGIERLQEIPGFYEFKLLKKPGEYVPPPTTFLGRVATGIFTAPTYSELKSKLDQAITLVSFS